MGPLLVIMLVASVVYRPSRAAAATILGTPQAYNLQATSFNFGWYTDSFSTGSIVVHSLSTCGDAGTAYGEVPADGYVHFSVTVPATASTTYYVTPLVNGTPSGCYPVTTLAAGLVPASHPNVSGAITYQPTCTLPASGVLASAYLSNGSTAAASPLAVVSSASGGYSIDLGTARSTDGSPFPLISGTTSITVSANASAFADAESETVTYSGPFTYSPCLPTVPVQGGTGTPTSTTTPTPTITPGGFVTSTPIATLTPSITPTPTSTSTPTPTFTPTVTRTPIPTNTLIPFPFATSTPPSIPPPPPPGGSVATFTPTPTSTPTPTVTSTPAPPPPPKPVKLKAWTRIHAKSLHPDGQQSVEVHTLAGAGVAMVVIYPDKVSSFSASGRANKQGVWRARWTVVALQRGRASVTFTVRFGRQKKVLHRYFTIR